MKVAYDTIPTRWKKVPLKDVVIFLDHLRRPIKADLRKQGIYPYYGANGQQGTIDGYIFDEPLALLAEDGGYFDDPIRPIAYRIVGKTWVNNHAHILKPKDSIDCEFLTYHLAQYDIRRYLSGTTRAKLTKSAAEQILIILPPLKEQRRIVDILNHASSIKRLRDDAKAKAREIIPALFVEMFGDPASNPKGWEQTTLGKIVEEFKYGTSVKCSDTQTDDSLPVLRIPNIIGGRVLWDDLKFAALESKERSKLLLQPNDLLFVRTNGNPDYIGRCAVYMDDKPTLFASYLIRARFNPNKLIMPRFIQELVSLPSYRQNLVRNSKTTAGNFNISIDGLERLIITVPPLPLQQEFGERVAEVEGISALNDKAVVAAEQLAQSLMSQVFGSAA